MVDGFKISGCSKDVFNKWLPAGYLKTKFPASSQGKQRKFTLENVLELTFLTSLTNIGFKVSEAVNDVDVLMRSYKAKTLPAVISFNPQTGKQMVRNDSKSLLASLRDFVRALPDDWGSGQLVPDGEVVSLEEPADFMPPAAMTFIFPQAIVARVVKAFAK